MGMTEQDFANALGVTLPQEEPAADQQQETAAEQPAQDPAPQGNEEQQQETEPQENPGQDEGQEPQQTEEQEPQVPDEETDPAGGKEALTPEQRAANAARRRKHEQQQAIDAAVEKARQEEKDAAAAQMAQVFKGMKNTYTGKEITTMDEYLEFRNRYETDQINAQLKEGKVTPEMLDQLISRNPAVQQANQIVAQAQQQKQQQEQINAAMQRDLDAIARIDPAMNGINAIMESKLGKSFQEHVTRGENFLSAFTNARQEAQAAQTATKAMQQKQLQHDSKAHLQSTGSTGGSVQMPVPAEVKKYFRLLNPGMTDAQMTEYYNKNMK